MKLTPAMFLSFSLAGGALLAGQTSAALPLLLIGITRMLNYFVPGGVHWVYFIIGGVLTGGGLLLWSRRPRGAARA